MIEINKKDCLWQQLKNEDRPIVLYGTGNGADKILDTCIKYNITISGVFASSGFVRHRTFRGFDVESLEAIENRLGSDLVVLLCFGTARNDVISLINDVAERHALYIPDVPLFGGELFDYDYFSNHCADLEAARALMSDEGSRKIFDDMLGFRLTGRGSYLANVQRSIDSYIEFANRADKYRVCVDCGAFVGDSTSEIASAFSPEKIIAVEPDMRTFKKLSSYAENEVRCTVEPIHAAIGDTDGEAVFTAAASRGSGTESIAKRSKTVTVPKVNVDSLCRGLTVDFIKYDVEGAEFEAIRGSLETVKRCSPALAVSLYHRSADLFELPLFLKKECGYTRFYLRRVPCIPAWDLTLFAFKK